MKGRCTNENNNKNEKNTYYWDYKKCFKNIAIAGTIVILSTLYIKCFFQYNAYLEFLMK